MGGFFGVASKKDCVLELFYGEDYDPHLGTRRGGMAAYGNGEFCRAIHNIENAPFRTKFDRDVDEMKGNLGIGCISAYEPQPLLIQSHHGSFAIVTVGKINNEEELLEKVFEEGHSHFQEMSGGKINATELVASLICKKETLAEGIHCDYGMQGILFISAFYICRNHRIYQVLLFLLAYMGTTGNQPPLCTLLACLLILLYNGKRGKLKLKYFFYVFYPAHILVLYLIQIGLGKYLLK